jgi:Mrp family chromosome partitioning ATPase
MSDMNFRALLGHGRRLLRRMRVDESTDQSAGTYALLALRLERDLARQGKGRSILITAAKDDSVALEATVELAWSLAADLGHTVLMVDGGFASNTLSAALAVDDKVGLSELLEGPAHGFAALQLRLQPTQHEHIAILPRGHDRETTIRVEAVRGLIAAACEHFDFVLVQGSLTVEPERSLAFGSLVDAALLFAVEDATTIDDVARGQRLLNDCGARRVALVLANRRQVPAPANTEPGA